VRPMAAVQALLVPTLVAAAPAADPLAPVDARTEPPVVITAPGAQFQDEARPGAMIIAGRGHGGPRCRVHADHGGGHVPHAAMTRSPCEP